MKPPIPWQNRPPQLFNRPISVAYAHHIRDGGDGIHEIVKKTTRGEFSAPDEVYSLEYGFSNPSVLSAGSRSTGASAARRRRRRPS